MKKLEVKSNVKTIHYTKNLNTKQRKELLSGISRKVKFNKDVESQKVLKTLKFREKKLKKYNIMIKEAKDPIIKKQLKLERDKYKKRVISEFNKALGVKQSKTKVLKSGKKAILQTEKGKKLISISETGKVQLQRRVPKSLSYGYNYNMDSAIYDYKTFIANLDQIAYESIKDEFGVNVNRGAFLDPSSEGWVRRVMDRMGVSDSIDVYTFLDWVEMRG